MKKIPGHWMAGKLWRGRDAFRKRCAGRRKNCERDQTCESGNRSETREHAIRVDRKEEKVRNRSELPSFTFAVLF